MWKQEKIETAIEHVYCGSFDAAHVQHGIDCRQHRLALQQSCA